MGKRRIPESAEKGNEMETGIVAALDNRVSGRRRRRSVASSSPGHLGVCGAIA